MAALATPTSPTPGAPRPSVLLARLRAFSALRLSALVLVGGCGSETVLAESPSPEESSEARSALSSGSPGPEPPPPKPAPASLAEETRACPADMALVEGSFPPHRSGIKGGWWGPVRNRCRPLVTFHDEGDCGDEVGFRCCADAKN